jgi:hypothetical protein
MVEYSVLSMLLLVFYYYYILIIQSNIKLKIIKIHFVIHLKGNFTSPHPKHAHMHILSLAGIL